MGGECEDPGRTTTPCDERESTHGEQGRHREAQRPRVCGSCCEYMVRNRSFLHYALPSAHLGRSPSALVARVDRYDTGVDLSKLTAPNSVVSVDI